MTRARIRWISPAIVMLFFGVGIVITASPQHKPSSSAAAETLMGAALHQEEVEGNLEAAIATYKEVIASARASRSLKATALLHLGRSYGKLGSAEDQQAYERIVREFPDQTDSVATARTRLASIRHASTGGNDISFRRVWDGAQNQAPQVSYDGRFIAYQFGPGSIMVRELATGKDYTLVNRQMSRPGPANDAEDPAISRDGKIVAYSWYTDGRYELRTVPVRSSPGQPRRLFRSEDVEEPTPFDWSPDGTRIAVHLLRDDGTSQIGLVSTADGSVNVLKSIDWSEYKKGNRWSIMSFSPDGKYLAYDLAADNNSGQRDVLVMAVDGGREIAAVAHPSDDTLAAWSPDGKQLLFLSDRTGSTGLWSQTMVDGRPQGSATLIKADLGALRSMGITASGALYVFSSVVDNDIEVVSVDFASGQMVGSPAKPITDHLGTNSQPEWSSDGKFMSYLSRREGRMVLAIRELATGNVQVIGPQLSNVASKAWSPDRKVFAIQGNDLKGRRGLFMVDAETGEASRLVTAGIGAAGGVAWSPDGKKLYHGGRIGTAQAFFERDMVSGAERQIIRRARLSIHISLSPDGRWIAAMTADAAGQAAIVFPASGGEARELMRTNQASLAIAFWAPDSNSVILTRGTFRDRWVEPVDYWQVPVSGGEPKRTDLKIDSATSPQWTWPRLHPDGRQVAFTTGGQSKNEVWVLENFLPKSRAAQ
jgi:Tol biopolymer transport system component